MSVLGRLKEVLRAGLAAVGCAGRPPRSMSAAIVGSDHHPLAQRSGRQLEALVLSFHPSCKKIRYLLDVRSLKSSVLDQFTQILQQMNPQHVALIVMILF